MMNRNFCENRYCMLQYNTQIWLKINRSSIAFHRYSDLVPVIFLHEFQEHLNKIINEGLANVIERHSTNSQRLQIGLEKMIGLELFVEMEQYRLPTVVTVKMPLGINDKSFTKYLSNK